MNISTNTDVIGVAKTDWPVAALAWTMLLVPALGVPHVFMLQDTLKSAVLAFGVLTAALLFFWQRLGRNEPLRWHGLMWLPLTLMTYALGSMVWSDAYLAGAEAVRWFVLALLMFVGLNTLTRERLPVLVWGIHLGAVVASVWLVLQFWIDFRLFPQAAPPSSTFINRNFFAEFAVTALPFSVWLLAEHRNKRWLGTMTLSVALVVLAIMMTGTRSALVALLVLLPITVFILYRYRHQLAVGQWRQRDRLLVALIFVGSIAGLGSLPSGNARVIDEGHGVTALQRSFLRVASLTKPTEYTQGSTAIRKQLWMATARMMFANQWSGVGAGAWQIEIPLYQQKATMEEVDYHAHNDFLQLLSEYGLPVGGGVLAVLLAYLLHAAGHTWQLHARASAEAPLRAFTLASLMVLLLVANAGFPWHLASGCALLALGLAILGASDARLGRKDRMLTTQMAWRPAYSRIALMTLAGTTLLAVHIARQAVQVDRQMMQAAVFANSYARTNPADRPQHDMLKSSVMQGLREAMLIHPHYREIVATIIDALVTSDDLVNAAWISEMTALTHPNVTAIWSNLAIIYAQSGQHQKAENALQQVQRVKPNVATTRALEVTLLYHAGQDLQAAHRLTGYFDRGQRDVSLIQAAYTIGVRTKQWPLAIRALELFIVTQPANAPDTYLKLGNVYADPALQDDTNALRAFKAGLASVSVEQQASYRLQVPEPYRHQL